MDVSSRDRPPPIFEARITLIRRHDLLASLRHSCFTPRECPVYLPNALKEAVSVVEAIAELVTGDRPTLSARVYGSEQGWAHFAGNRQLPQNAVVGIQSGGWCQTRPEREGSVIRGASALLRSPIPLRRDVAADPGSLSFAGCLRPA